MKTLMNFAMAFVRPTDLATFFQGAWPLLSKSKRIVAGVRAEYVLSGLAPEYVEAIPTSQLCYPERWLSIPSEMMEEGWCPKAFSYNK